MKGRYLSPLLVPEVAQSSHLYTSITRERASPPRGSGIAPQSRAKSHRTLSAPLFWLRPRALRLLCRCRSGPPPCRGSGHPRWFCLRLPCHGGGTVRGVAVRAGGRLVGGPGGLGGHQVPHVGVDVVDGLEWWWAWCAGICWIPGGMHPTAWTSGCGGAPPPFPCPAPCPSPPAPVPRPACPWKPRSRFPSWPLGPLPAPSPWFWRAPSPLPSGRCRVSLRLSPAPLPFLLAPASFLCPCLYSLLWPAFPHPLPPSWPAPWACPPPLLLVLVPARALASVLWRCRSGLRPSRALAPVLRRVLCPSVRSRRPGPPRVPVLPRCCWPWCPARVLALSLCCVRSGPSPAFGPWRSLCRLPPLAPCSRDRHPAPAVRRLAPPGTPARHLAAAAAAAA